MFAPASADAVTGVAGITDAAVFSVAADACAGLSDTVHQRALDAMPLYAPLIEITDSAGVLGSLR